MCENIASEFMEAKEKFEKLGYELVGINDDLGLYFVKEQKT